MLVNASQHAASCCKRLAFALLAFMKLCCQKCAPKHIWRKINPNDIEKPKTVLRSGIKALLAKIWVHIPPVLTAIVLFYLNLAGYFIGSQLQGFPTSTFQSFYRLCLQVAAKLFEVLVTASLGVIIMDAVRYKLLVADGGLPLGLLMAKAQFTDGRYLLSHEFRAGWMGLKLSSSRLVFGLLIFASSLIALFVGPSAAILIIPSYYAEWHAGKTSFWINGDLNPAKLDASSYDQRCNQYSKNASTFDLTTELVSCPWAGHTFLADEFEQRALWTDRRITYDGGTFMHSIDMDWGEPSGYDLPESLRLRAIASNMAVATFSRYLAGVDWCDALYANWITLGYGQVNGSRASVRSSIPVVRTQCLDVDVWKQSDFSSSMPQELPSPDGKSLLPFPAVSTFFGRDYVYFIPVVNLTTSSLTTTWIPVPSGPSRTNFVEQTETYPSAFLLIRTVTNTITCSIHADWVLGYSISTELCWDETIQQASLDNEDFTFLDEWEVTHQWDPSSPEFRKPFMQPSNFKQVELTTAWLNALTPQVSSASPGRTTLALLLEKVLLKAYPAVYSEARHSSSYFQINAIIASFVVDGMSRIGWDQNFLNSLNSVNVTVGTATTQIWTYNAPDWKALWRKLINGHAKLITAPGYRDTNGNSYSMQVSVAGYGIKASGTAYYLALTVLFVYVVLVCLHIVFVAYTLLFKPERGISGAWSTLTDLLVLSQSSVPLNSALRNTSAGIQSHTTLKLPMRIRECPGAALGDEELQMLADEDRGKKVDKNKEYGVI